MYGGWQVKITDAGIIQTGEEELINRIIERLDWGTIAEILRAKYGLTFDNDSISYRQGDLVAHQGQVAYKLDFEVKVSLSVMVDRKGECFDVVTSVTQERQAPGGQAEDDTKPSGQQEKIVTDADRSAAEPPSVVTGPGERQAPDKGDHPSFLQQEIDSSDMASRIADIIAEINNS